MIIPVSTNIVIKGLPILDADGNEMDTSITTYRKGEILAIGETVDLPIKVGDIVYLNKANFFLILADNEYLCHSSAVFAVEREN